MLQENGWLCIALACLDNVALLTFVLGSGNNAFLAKESNAHVSQRFEKEPRGGRKLRIEREETDK